MSTTKSLNRMSVLARMACVAPDRKLGRTQMMKLFYFLQELKGVPLGNDFRLFTYGPFDAEVLSDLATACSLGLVKERTVVYSRGYGYEITPEEGADKLSRELSESHPELAALIDETVRDFASCSAAELELRSTILFVDREFSQAGFPVDAKVLAERVQQIKPHFSEPVIRDRIADMLKNAWLTSLRNPADEGPSF